LVVSSSHFGSSSSTAARAKVSSECSCVDSTDPSCARRTWGSAIASASGTGAMIVITRARS
jgi:hypothetical protein